MVCFGSTYEGLKPGEGVGRLDVAPRFGSTYEGLKPLIAAKTAERHAGFGSTYEGLKRDECELVFAPAAPVLAVPMRA